VAAVALLIGCLAIRRITPRTVATWAAGGVLVALPFTPQLLHVYRNSLQSDHFSVELDARFELNHLALDMFEDKPLLGVGLNNFQRSMPRYDRYGLIFFGGEGRAGHPVHNIFLLQLSESGLIGLAGLALVGISLLVVGLRLARSADPLLGGIGAGVAAVYIFFLVEESLVFSLRQDQPLALYWILAGLSVACLRLSGWRPTVTRPAAAPLAQSRPPRRRRQPLAVPMAVLVMAPSLVGFGDGVGPAPSPDTAGLRIVFAGVPRAGGHQAVHVVNGDGTGLRRVTPDDGRDYSWPSWAMGGTKIIFSVRGAGVGSPENIAIVDADGSNFRQLTNEPWRHGQPKVSPDGRTVIFSAFWPEFDSVGIYRLDLETLQVVNLSARAGTPGAADGDPRWSADGSRIVFANGASPQGIVPTQSWIMNADGTGRQPITRDSYYNTDPALSPDGREVAIASYRGEGNPSSGDADDPFRTKLVDFRLVVRDMASGAERELTRGAPCYTRIVPPDSPCSPAEASAYVPVWTPSGDGIGFLAALDATTTCICVGSPDGGHARAVFAAKELALRWFDWVRPGTPPDSAVVDIGARAPTSRLVFSGTNDAGVPFLAVSEPDRYGERRIPIPPFLSDIAHPRLTPDGEHVIFTALTAAVAGNGTPHPPPPAGEEVHQHFTLELLATNSAAPPSDREHVGREQVYLMALDGTGLLRLTDAWLEDYRDAMAPGEARGNDQADFSPDGRYLVFRNRSSSTDESFVLRLDTRTGGVLSLTNATAGALPTHDESPRFSPDGGLVAFSASTGPLNSQIVTVQASDGFGFRQLTDDDYVNLSPAWSPDGREIVYVSYRGGQVLPADPSVGAALPLTDWHLVKVDVASGIQTVLTDALGSPAFSPAWSPDGRSITFISLGPPGQPDIHTIAADGAGTAIPVQITLLSHESSLDWR
jgi:Tol biopolymer transport system component